jgi:hypothetical protein
MRLKNRVERLEYKKGDPYLDRSWARVICHDWEDKEEAIDIVCVGQDIIRQIRGRTR